MMNFKRLYPWLTAYGGGLARLAIASWLLTNTMFLLGSRVPFITLDFVRQISLESFLGIWMGIYLCMAFPYLILTGSNARHVSLVPSTAIYIAALALQGSVIL